MADIEPHPFFESRPDSDNPGWTTWNMRDDNRYNAFLGPISIRGDEADGIGWVRMLPEMRHSNLGDSVHGGTILGFIDVCLFAGSRAIGIDFSGRAVTVDLSTQFVGGAHIGLPLDCRIELVRETGSLVFLRGMLMQRPGSQADYANIATFSGIVRKRIARR